MKKWFTPKAGLRMIDPQTKAEVPAAGQWVFATDEFYNRRVIDKDGAFSDAPPSSHADAGDDSEHQ